MANHRMRVYGCPIFDDCSPNERTLSIYTDIIPYDTIVANDSLCLNQAICTNSHVGIDMDTFIYDGALSYLCILSYDRSIMDKGLEYAPFFFNTFTNL